MGNGKAYDPNGSEAMIATILARLDEQDRTTVRNHAENRTANAENRALMLEVKEEVSRTNGRVRWLEKAFWTISGGIIVLGTLGGWYAAMHPAAGH